MESIFKPSTEKEFEEYKKCMEKFLKEARKIDFSQPERLTPEDASVKIYIRTDDGVWDILEPCICDSPTPDNK
jgi:hypothetical protein